MSLSSEHTTGVLTANVTIPLPMFALAIPPRFEKSSQDYINPFRDMDVMGIPNFFDHAASLGSGTVAAMAVTYAGVAIDAAMRSERAHPVAIASVAGAASVGFSVAYEAGVVGVPLIGRKAPEAATDWPDAAFGGAAGLIYSLAFCGAALVQKYRTHKAQRQHNT